MLVSGFEAITQRIEEVGEWAKLNGPLLPDEKKTVELMIQCQIARGFCGFDPEEVDGNDSQD